MQLKENFNLQPFNTFGINVSCKYFASFENENEFLELLSYDKIINENKLILGGGSNILFTQNFNGIILKNNLQGIEIIKKTSEHIFVKVSAGVVWHQFVLYCIENNFCGVENLSLIPGYVGAAPMQNIGAYGVEVKDVIEEVSAINILDKSEKIFTNKECDFGYRESIFKHIYKNQFVITSVIFKLNVTANFKTNYGVINNELEKMGVKELSIRSISDAIINIRSSKLPNPKELGNAGSFFKNPSITNTQFEELKNTFPTIVGYPNENNNLVKLAAGWLIEQSGFKGVKFGNTGCHRLQALVLVNYGNATGKEIYDYSTKIIETIKQKFDVILEREVNII